jgi:putative salt-induced outer membrane protein YdiY
MPSLIVPPRIVVAGALFISAPVVFSTSILAEEIELKGGDRLTGTILERNNDRIVLDHDALGRLEIALDRVVSINDGGAGEGPSASPAMLSDETETESDGKEWQSSFKLGLSSSFGNTDTQNLNAGIESFRESDADKTTLDAYYYYGAADGDRDTNKFTAGVRQDWFVPDSRWLYFAQGRYDYDEFQSWEHRLGAHGGVGYRLIEKDDLTLTLRGGAGVIKEFGSDDEDLRPEGLLGADLAWQISQRQTFTAATTIYPDLSEGGEFRAVSSAEWSAMVDEESSMSVFARLEHEYQSKVDPGFEKNDFRIIAGLQFDF